MLLTLDNELITLSITSTNLLLVVYTDFDRWLQAIHDFNAVTPLDEIKLNKTGNDFKFDITAVDNRKITKHLFDADTSTNPTQTHHINNPWTTEEIMLMEEVSNQTLKLIYDYKISDILITWK